MRRHRRGYALLAVLWVLTFAAELGAGMRLSARDGALAVENRVRLTRAAWTAEGCVERARAAIDAALAQAVVACRVRLLSALRGHAWAILGAGWTRVFEFFAGKY